MGWKQHEYYKTEKGFQAITRWYDSLVDQFNFEFDSEYVDSRYGNTHMLTAGSPDAEPLVLVQAIAGSAPLWYHQIPFFAEHFRVYALDTPGQPGRSDPNPPPLLQGGYTEWLLSVMEGLGIQRASFVGVSSAGWHVMKLAIRAPELTKRIVMISPTGLARGRLPIKIMLTNVLSKRKDDQALEDDLSTRSFMPSSASQDFDRQLARAMALATRHYRIDRSLGIFDDRRGRVKIRESLRVLRALFFPEPRNTLERLTVPGLVILGEHEMLFNSEKVAQKIERTMPTLDVTIIPETGHSAMYDRPEAVNQAILDFLRRGPSTML